MEPIVFQNTFASSNQNSCLSKIYVRFEVQKFWISYQNWNNSIMPCSMFILTWVGIIFVNILKILTNIMATHVKMSIEMAWKNYFSMKSHTLFGILHLLFLNILFQPLWHYFKSNSKILRWGNKSSSFIKLGGKKKQKGLEAFEITDLILINLREKKSLL